VKTKKITVDITRFLAQLLRFYTIKKEDIMAALDRNAFIDADSVDIKVENGKVTL